jgi:hypothetical protein
MSTLTGWWRCAAWQKDRSPPGAPAKLGKGLHSCLETYLGGEVPDLTAIAHMQSVRTHDFPLLQSMWRSIEPWARERRARGARPEQAFAIDVATGTARFLGERLPKTLRAYASENELVGAADVVEYVNDEATLWDLKTGTRGPAGAEEQVRSLGVAVFGASKRLKRVHLRVLTPNAREHDMGVVDCLDVGAFRWELRAAVERPKVPRAGAWCRDSYCAGAKQKTCAEYARYRGSWTSTERP